MEVTLTIHEYSEAQGLMLSWRAHHSVVVQVESDEVIIRANSAGLISLANHLLTLAQEKVPSREHLHLDDSNSLEAGSASLIIEKL
jgi:hypothetical protein